MIPEILDAYEKAARIYCRKVGDDPDQELVLPSEEATLLIANKPPRTAPRWHFVAVELHDMSLRLLALREAVQPAKAAKGAH